MNHTKATPEELAEDRRNVQMFRDAGIPEYWACMYAAQLRIAK